MSQPEWYADRVEEDRCVVLLVCGHWTQTRQVNASTWPCPDDHGMQDAAITTSTGSSAVLGSWVTVYDDPDWADVVGHG